MTIDEQDYKDAINKLQLRIKFLERKIEILESKESQFESTLKETMKIKGDRIKMLEQALEFIFACHSFEGDKMQMAASFALKGEKGIR